MIRTGRILLVDDNPEWLSVLRGLLEDEGYLVGAVTTFREALRLLDAEFYHLLILDIRMDDTDADNQQGMDLLRELENRKLIGAVQVVMLSAYATLSLMREAFSLYEVADFLEKDAFKSSDFIKRINQIFAERMKINLDLKIRWQSQGPEPAVLNLKIQDERIKQGSPRQQLLALEMDDLLCRLFHKADNLLVRPLDRGKSGAGVVNVQPFYSTGGAQARVVKFGDVKDILKEKQNFDDYVQGFIGGGRSTTIHDYRRTQRLAGLMYSFLGAANDPLQSFASYYSNANQSQISDVLDRLFLSTCSPWYANPGQLVALDLTSHYQQRLGFSLENLERALTDKLKVVHGKNKTFTFPTLSEKTFTNPISCLDEEHFLRTTYKCITHGDLNPGNVWVDSTGYAWLIDFGSTGPGHILQDVAELDSLIRLELLAAEEASLTERVELEEILCDIQSFSQLDLAKARFKANNEALQKAFLTSMHLRTIAAKLIALHRSDDISEYQIALFYFALNSIRFYSLDTVQRQHALVCASVLADRLKP